MSRLPEMLYSPDFLRAHGAYSVHHEVNRTPLYRSLGASLRELWQRGTHVTRADHTDVSCPKCVRVSRESAARSKINLEAIRSLV